MRVLSASRLFYGGSKAVVTAMVVEKYAPNAVH